MKIELNKYVDDLKIELGISLGDKEFRKSLIDLLVANNWFGVKKTNNNGALLIEQEEMDAHKDSIRFYFINMDKPQKEKIRLLYKKESNIFPMTVIYLKKFSRKHKVDEKQEYTLATFLFKNLKRELSKTSTCDIENLIKEASRSVQRKTGNLLLNFLNWIQEHYDTEYKIYGQRFRSKTIFSSSEPYSDDIYWELFYLLIDETRIKKHDMIKKAARNKNFCDAWLYIILHFITAQRDTDLLRIVHPPLTYSPDETLDSILEDRFDKEEAMRIILYYEGYYKSTNPKPHKTKGAKNALPIVFNFPHSSKRLFGTLFAIAESHFRIYNMQPDEPLIRQFKDYKQIKNYFGCEVGELFRCGDFRNRSINKSYIIQNYKTTVVFNDVFDPKLAYRNAANARSHLGVQSGSPAITHTYLKNAYTQKNIENAEKILFERGICSFVPKMTADLITNGKINDLSLEAQNEVINSFSLTPFELDSFLAIYRDTYEKAKKLAFEIVNNFDEEKIINAFIDIGMGNARSKTDGIDCLLQAFNRRCVHPEKQNCVSCRYNLFRTNAVLLLATELNKHIRAIKDVELTSSVEYQRHKFIINTLKEKLYELLACLKGIYGNEEFEILLDLIKEINNYDE